MKHRLALAACRGWRQQSLVNEMLAGQVAIAQDRFGHVIVGETQLPWASFRNLRDRLVGMGFVFAITDTVVELKFPEDE